MSKAAGFSSVSDLLQKNPGAKRPQSASVDPSKPKVRFHSPGCASLYPGLRCRVCLPQQGML